MTKKLTCGIPLYTALVLAQGIVKLIFYYRNLLVPVKFTLDCNK